jgi:hypothetical protein
MTLLCFSYTTLIYFSYIVSSLMNCMTLVSGAMKHTNQIVYLDFVDYILIRGPYVEVQVYTNSKHVYQLHRKQPPTL